MMSYKQNRMKIKNTIIDLYGKYLKWNLYKKYSKQFKRYCILQNIPDTPVDGEMEYIRKWSILTPRVEPYSYRLFSRYMGNDPNIVPEDIGHVYLENVLNPRRYRDYYTDKNIFDDMFHEGVMPVTVLRRMAGGRFLDAGYQIVNNSRIANMYDFTSCNRLILKPSVDSSSGSGVILFEKIGDEYVAKKENVRLSLDFLFSYGKDFILQEAIEQHPDLARFNPTSVNTLRLLTYRSVKDESVHVVAGILRVGRSGEVCDNAHMGGRIVGVDLYSGKLGNYVCDQYGNRSNTWNGVDYQIDHFIVPCWGEVLSFASFVGSKIRHCRLVQLDITINKEGIPKLIEFNVCSCGFWLYMFCGQRPFGAYTDEVIEYCLMSKNNHPHLRIV